jgi:hypothetical protein
LLISGSQLLEAKQGYDALGVINFVSTLGIRRTKNSFTSWNDINQETARGRGKCELFRGLVRKFDKWVICLLNLVAIRDTQDDGPSIPNTIDHSRTKHLIK